MYGSSVPQKTALKPNPKLLAVILFLVRTRLNLHITEIFSYRYPKELPKLEFICPKNLTARLVFWIQVMYVLLPTLAARKIF